MSKMKASRMIRLTLVSTSVAAALMLAGCSVNAPEKLSSDDLMRLANVDQQLMFAAQEPVTAPITMEEAVARALKYNLEHRLAMMERAVQENIADVQSMSLLPKLTASAGYRDRSNELASSSESLATGKESLVPSKSSERDGRTADLELSWNVLDFGLSYFEAQASTNKSYASEERRRRVVADIARQTRAAWLSAVSAERSATRRSTIRSQRLTTVRPRFGGGRPMMPERGGSKGFRALRIRFAMRPFRLGSLSAWAASQMLIRPALLLCRVPPWPMNSCSPSMCSSIRRPRITTE